MADPRVVRDDEEIRFVRDVELLMGGKPVSEVTDASYEADLAVADLLIRARFVPTAEFKASLRSKLQNQLEIERRRLMIPFFSGSLFRQLFRGVVTAGLAASLLSGALLVVSPTARAQVQDLIVRFVEVDSPWALLSAPSEDAESPRAGLPTPSGVGSPGAALPTPDPAQAPGAGVSEGVPGSSDIPAPSLPKGLAPQSEQALVSLEEAQTQTSFTIKMPTVLPDGYSFKGVLKLPSLPRIEEPLPAGSPVSLPSAVTLIFEDAGGEVLMLSEMKLITPAALVEADRAAPSLGEIKLPAGEGSVQEVTVNGQPGQYVEGGWSSQGWDSNANHRLLHWQADGMTYSLLSRTLGLSELLAVAESIPS
jgi:hypothetical protein